MNHMKLSQRGVLEMRTLIEPLYKQFSEHSWHENFTEKKKNTLTIL